MKKFFSSIKQVTGNNTKGLATVYILGILGAFFKMFPYGVLIGAVLEFLNPLLNPGAAIDTGRLWFYFSMIVFLYILQFFVGKIQYVKSFSNGITMINRGRGKFAEHLKRLPMGFFSNYDAGKFSTYMLDDYENVLVLLSDGLEPILSALAAPLVGFLFMLFINWKLTLYMMLPVVVALPLVFLWQKISGRLAKKLFASRTTASSRMVEYIESMQLVKAFNLQGEKFERLEHSFAEIRKNSLRMEIGAGLGVVLAKIILYSGIPILMAAGWSFLSKGIIGVPVYVMFLMIAPRIYEPIASVFALSTAIGIYFRSVERIKNIYDEAPLPEPENDKKIEGFEIALDDIKFRYEDSDVLKGITADIPEKEITALVGASGSGKTTITRLIARFWDVNEGAVSVGGVNIRDLPYDKLIANISIVFQDVFLFNDTVMNNIMFGRPDATKEEAIAAAAAAACHDFISALPEGYDTIVGEGGSTLSGGEKQRISIARAILKDAPIILLDEATASLDPENEAYIQAAIENLVKDKTLIVIAHKLKTIQHADKILVLKNGRIAEAGQHDELLNSGGIYAHLWNEQQTSKGWKIK